MTTPESAFKALESANLFLHPRLKAKKFNRNARLAQWAQEKIDGFRFTIYKQPNRTLLARGSDLYRPIEYMVQDQLWYRAFAALSDPCHDDVFPPCTSIDGEIIVYDKAASEVAHHLATGKPMTFCPFALPFLAGMDQSAVGLKPTIDRIELIVKRAIQVSPDCFRKGPSPIYYPLFCDYDGNNPGENERLLEAAATLGLEGWIVKQANCMGWWKLKVEHTIDCFITGFEQGQGKYSDTVGALLVSVFKANTPDAPAVETEIAKVSGMTDAERYGISNNDLRRVCEVKYQCVTPYGRLRHPRFVRWRPDKQAAECTWEAQVAD